MMFLAIKILGINGSPRTYGNTYKMLLLAMYTAKHLGAEIDIINLYEKRIEPCLGCLCDNQYACKYPCVIEDDMQEINKIVLESDGIIFATPIYWFNTSGPMKNLLDRLTAFENMVYFDEYSWLEGKVSGVIASGAESGTAMVVSNLLITLNSYGMLIPPWGFAYYTGKEDVLKDDTAVLDAINVGRVVYLATKGKKVKRWYDPRPVYLREIIESVRREVEKNYSESFPARKGKVFKLLDS